MPQSTDNSRGGSSNARTVAVYVVKPRRLRCFTGASVGVMVVKCDLRRGKSVACDLVYCRNAVPKDVNAEEAQIRTKFDVLVFTQ